MTRTIGSSKYRNIYLFWGLHFSTLKSPKHKPDQKVFNVLAGTLADLQADYNSTADPRVKQQCQRLFQFILQEIKTNFTPLHLAQFNAEIAGRLAQSNEPSSQDDQIDDDLISRGVIDL